MHHASWLSVASCFKKVKKILSFFQALYLATSMEVLLAPFWLYKIIKMYLPINQWVQNTWSLSTF